MLWRFDCPAKVSEAVYAAAAQQAGASEAQSGDSGEAPDDVVDAEFTVVNAGDENEG